MKQECAVVGCDRVTYARGWCRAHYEQARKSGWQVEPRMERTDDLHRFLNKVSRDASGCWLWTGPLTEDGASQRGAGYGRFKLHGRTVAAHRASFLLHGGTIPEGMQLDHLCRRRACVNPEHLEPVTPRENLLRGDTVNARNAGRTECVRGHAFVEHGFVDSAGKRQCRPCSRLRQARYRAHRRQPA